MSNEAKVEKIRGKHLALQNDRQEAMARPGRSEKAVVISRATLDYYKGLENLLNEALELVATHHPPVIEIDARVIGEAMTAAAVNAIAEVTGLQVPVLAAADEKAALSVVDAAKMASVFAGAAVSALPPKKAVPQEPSWFSVDNAVNEAGIELGPVMSAVYGGKIKKRGRGKTLEVHIASFRRWVEAYKQRTGK